MNRKQSNKLTMYLAIRAVLISYRKIWQSLAGFVLGVDEFNEGLANIDELARTQTSKTGASAFKAQAFTKLVDAAVEIGSATRAWAVAKGNDEIAAQLDYTRASLSKGQGTDVLVRCRAILKIATENADSLPDYGVTADKLAGLKQKVESFKTVQVKPQHGRATSKAATKALPDLFDQLDKVLDERLDGLIVQFKDSKPAFFNEYTAARTVRKVPAGRSAKEDISTTEPGATDTSESGQSIQESNGENTPVTQRA